MEVGITGDNTYGSGSTNSCTHALAIVPSIALSKLSNRDTTVNHEMVGEPSVKRVAERARALSKLAGFYISRRNGSLMSSFGLFKRSESRWENLLSSLVESFHSRARTNLNNTKGFIDIRIEISFLYDYSDQSRVVLSSNSSSWRDLRY